MKRMLLLSGLLLCALSFLKAQGYLNQDITLTTGSYNYSGFGNITITVPLGEIVQLNCNGYGSGNLIINGQLTVNNSTGNNLQVAGNVLLGPAATLTVNGSFTTQKNVTLDKGAILSVTKDYNSNLDLTSNVVHLMENSQFLVEGNGAFNAGRLLMDGGSVFTAKGDVIWANPGSQISGALTVGKKLTINNGPNQLSCPGSITMTTLLNSAAIVPIAFSGSGYIKITGNIEVGSGNPLTSDPTIVVDYNGAGGNFGAATRGSTSPCTVTLAVNLIGFSATDNKKAIDLAWQTATEVNNKGFYVQRSTDAIHYSNLAFVASKAFNGNSTQALSYEFKDLTPASNNFYRLQQVDLDGRIHYSDIIHQAKSGSATLETTSILAYPVPAGDFIYFASSVAGALTIYDQNGRQVFKGMIKEGETKVGIAHLKSGIYYYQIGDKKGRFIKK